MEDHRILSLFLNRDEQAISETSRIYGSYCHAVAKTILDNDADAEETVSDAFLQAWNTIPPQKPVNLKLYLAKITRNRAFSKWRSQNAEKRGGGQVHIALEELGDCIPGNADVAQELDKKELGKTISAFLRNERERDRAVFLRRYFYLEDTGSIARRYGLREANVLQILSRTRRKLKDYLIKEGYAL